MSAYPRAVTAAMVREFLRGGAAVNVLARAHDARVRVVDVGVDDDLADTPPEVSRHKVRRGSGAIDREDALTVDEVEAGLVVGRAVADEEIDAGADLLVPGDMGIGNTTVAATLVGAVLRPRRRRRGRPRDRGRRRDLATQARRRRRPPWCGRDPTPTTRSGCCGPSAAPTWPPAPASCSAPRSGGRRCCWTAWSPGPAPCSPSGWLPVPSAWWCAGHRSTEPAHRLALGSLGLLPLLDLELRLGEASGALTALPVLRAAALLLAGMTTLDSVTLPVTEPV